MDALSTSIISTIDASPRDLGAYRDLSSLLENMNRDGKSDHGALLEARRVISRAIAGGWLDASGLEFMGGFLRDALTYDVPSTSTPSPKPWSSTVSLSVAFGSPGESSCGGSTRRCGGSRPTRRPSSCRSRCFGAVSI